MITVIDENEYYEGQYDNMTLAEAGEQMIIDITESANEFQMGVLLFEHSYLYETGNEIDYLTEAEGRDNIVKRFINWVKNTAWPAIRDFFKRAEDAIYEFFASTIPNMFSKIGLNKKNFQNILSKYGSTSKVCKAVTKWVDYDQLNDLINEFNKPEQVGVSFDKSYTTKKSGRQQTTVTAKYADGVKAELGNKDVYSRKSIRKAAKEDLKEIDSYVLDKQSIAPNGGILVDRKMLENAGNVIFNKNSILKDLSKAKNSANLALNKYIKLARQVKNDDDISTVVSLYTNAIKENTKIYRMGVKYYTLHVSNCAKIIRWAANVVGASGYKAGESAAEYNDSEIKGTGIKDRA